MTRKKPASSNREATGETAESRGEAKPDPAPKPNPDVKKPRETGGPAGPDPTRYGDWERKGILSDF